MPGVFYDFDKWGPAVWAHAHCYTFRYPETPSAQDRAQAATFFTLLPFTLPCSACGLHFVKMLKEKHPLTDKDLASRDSLARWLNRAHNTVNRRLGKPETSYEDAKKIFLTSELPFKAPPAAVARGRGLPIALSCVSLVAVALFIVIVMLLVQHQQEEQG